MARTKQTARKDMPKTPNNRSSSTSTPSTPSSNSSNAFNMMMNSSQQETKRKQAEKAARQPKRPKVEKIDGKTLEQHRRSLGDSCKAQISCEKYTIAAECHAEVDMSLAVFRCLVVPNASRVVPADFDEATPVVSALATGSSAIGEICGHSKIKGGNRMQQWSAYRMQFVFYPSTEEMSIWWTMR